MDPRVFFKHNPSSPSVAPASSPLSATSSSTDDTSDLAHCRYSSFYSTQCVNSHCDTVRQQFRQCDNRPPEQLLTDDKGQQRWQPTDEAAMRATTGAGLTADVSWPDPVTNLFDELRAQTRLVGDAFRQWDEQATGRRDDENERGEEQSEDSEVGGVVGGMLNMLHGMSREFVDALFDRSTRRPSSPRRTDDASSGDVDDEL